MDESGMTPEAGTEAAAAQATDSITTHIGTPETRETLLGGDNNNPADTAATQQGETGNIAPEQYEAFTLPEGVDANNEQVRAALDEAKGVFKELGLKQEQAQKLINLHMKHWMGGAVETEELLQRQIEEQVAEWEAELRRNPRLKEDLMFAKRAIAYAGGKELIDALNKTGVGSHPAIVAAFAKLGRDFFREDHFVNGAGARPVDNSPSGMAARIYPEMTRRA